MIELYLLRESDAGVLDHVAPDVFDGPVVGQWARDFLADRRHHLIVAIADGVVVGMISGVDYLHPDKPPQLWINEVGVAPSYQRQGIGRRLLDAMLVHGRRIGCTTAWLGTEEENAPARRLYRAAGGTEEPFVMYEYELPRKEETTVDRPATASAR